jgi:hypothetical protein
VGGGGVETASIDSEAIEDLRALGAHEAADALEAKKRAEVSRETIFPIESENADAFRLFLRMQSQWKVATLSTGMGSAILLTGLDYTALPVVAAALGITIGEYELDALRFMERETVRLDTERQQRALRR